MLERLLSSSSDEGRALKDDSNSETQFDFDSGEIEKPYDHFQIVLLIICLIEQTVQ